MVLKAAWQRRPGRWHVLVLTLVWFVAAVAIAAVLFVEGSRATVIAGHDAEVRPTLDGYATLDLGPYLPRFRVPTGQQVGAAIDVGATDLESYSALVERYAVLASQPEAQVDKLRAVITDLAVDSLVLGGLIALAAPGIVLLVGRRRWAELAHPWTLRSSLAAGSVLVLVVTAVLVVRDAREPPVRPDTWTALPDALPEVAVPQEIRDVEVESGLITRGTERLVKSALGTYSTSRRFYSDLIETAPSLVDQLHQPDEGEVVALVVSDRHDNVGMDPVARAIGEAGGASFLLDAGDDTSTGSSWEAFSLESLDENFDDMDDRFSVAGNHDNGNFVDDTLTRLGFTTLRGEVVDGPAGIRLLGASDVRSSGLGSWRDENGEVTFDEQRTLLADLACEQDDAGERISTLLVHDANSGREALEHGCVDLVVAGHLHVQVGPDQVTGANGQIGYSYTNGTTGGAAYALALGSKLRRDAGVSLVTYRDGRPIGTQSVLIRTTGSYEVGPYSPLILQPSR